MTDYQIYLALAGIIGGGFLLYLIALNLRAIARHKAIILAGFLGVSVTLNVCAAGVLYVQYTGKITQFASAGYKVTGVNALPPVMEANATYDPQVEQAHQRTAQGNFTPEYETAVATGTH